MSYTAHGLVSQAAEARLLTPESPDRDLPVGANWHFTDPVAFDGLPTGKLGEAVHLLAAQGIVAAQHGTRVSLSRRKAWWSGHPGDLGPLTYTTARDATRFLVEGGLIDLRVAKARPGGTGEQTTFVATGALMDLATGVPLQHRPRQLILVRDADGKPIDVEKSPRLVREWRALAEWNAALAGSAITLDHPDFRPEPFELDGMTIDPRRTGLVRIYNETLERGGRAYGGWWQWLAQREHGRRDLLLIDGEPTAELDYSACTMRLQYGKAGKTLDRDPYTVPGVDRDHVKKACLILQNVDKTRNANALRDGLGAMAAHLADGTPGARDYAQANRILTAVEKHHAPIADGFWHGIGLELHVIEARIVAQVAKHCLGAGIVPLPIHDSLRVQARHADRLREFMVRAWVDATGTQPLVK